MNESLADPIPNDISLFKGSTIYLIFCRLSHVRPQPHSTRLRALVVSLVAWLPLLLFTSIRNFSGEPVLGLPFLHDFALHARFLIALPILILAEDMINPRLNAVIFRFPEKGFVSSADMPRFAAAVDAAKRMRNAIWPEALLMAIIAINSVISVQASVEAGRTSWRLGLGSGGSELTAAYFWFSLVAAPIFQFHIFRWVWRLMIWARLLWHISQLDLLLEGAHPDKAGGLGFLNPAQGRFAVLLFAASSVISAHIGALILFKAASLFDFKGLIATFVISSVLLFVAPLIVFTPLLLKIKRQSLRDYGDLALAYTQMFRKKWLAYPTSTERDLLGSPDLQSLADLAGSFDVVVRMKIILPNRQALVPLAIAAILPMLPLLMTVYPLPQIFNILVSLLL